MRDIPGLMVETMRTAACTSRAAAVLTGEFPSPLLVDLPDAKYIDFGCLEKKCRSECSFLHRLPPPQSTLPDASLDVFGREKHSDYRDDMGGVGSFSRQNRTLYIGRLREINKNTEELVETHFQEWGEIERSQFASPRTHILAFCVHLAFSEDFYRPDFSSSLAW
jgi:hypothetical protein